VSGEELVDIVDDDDRVIGRVTRAEMRARRLRHRCVYIILLDAAGRVFTHRRTRTKDVYPGFWDTAIGGVVASGEDYDRGAVREVAEEVGLHGVELKRLFPIDYEDEYTRVSGMVYSCISDQPLSLQAAEIEEGRWATVDELVEMSKRERFCPDGLVVFDRYRRQSVAGPAGEGGR
jgi:isopentenyldiphosphate isomerase